MAALDTVTAARMRAAVEALRRRGEPVAAYLFGSRAAGRSDEWSDYDIAVFIRGAETWDARQVARYCAEIQREAGDDIELHVFPALLHGAPPPASFAAHIIATGIQLPVA